MAANVASVSYANVARKAAGTSEDNDSQNPSESQPQEQPQETRSEKNKRKKRIRAAKKHAAKAAAAMEAAEKAKANSESSEAEAETPVAPVYVDAPPPKVNVWKLKQATPEQQPSENKGNEENESDLGGCPTSEAMPAQAASAIMKESTADNRQPQPPPKVEQQKEPVKPATNKPAPIIVTSGKTSAGSPWKTPAQNAAQVCPMFRLSKNLKNKIP